MELSTEINESIQLLELLHMLDAININIIQAYSHFLINKLI